MILKVLLGTLCAIGIAIGSLQLGWMLHSAQTPVVAQVSSHDHTAPRVIQVDGGGGM